MIFTIMFIIIYSFFTSILGFLPVASSLPSGLSSAVSYIFGFLHILSFVISTSTLFSVLFLALTIEGIVILWHIVHWLIRKIPFLHIN